MNPTVDVSLGSITTPSKAQIIQPKFVGEKQLYSSLVSLENGGCRPYSCGNKHKRLPGNKLAAAIWPSVPIGTNVAARAGLGGRVWKRVSRQLKLLVK